MIENLHVPFDLITRREVKKILGLKGKKIGDKEIRAEMIKRWGQLPGMASHGWQALALGTAWLIKNGHLGLDKGAETR